ncbi:MAG: rhodanese-like domain-containing protein [Bacteroidetes bacterium]|nr:rhodanese-like domain-containing protein [Bacteroidota bacterium]
MSVKTISVSELKKWIDEKKDFQLIDVRESNEHTFCNIGGDLIPLSTVLVQKNRISKDKPVAVLCRSGKRSEMAIQQLESAEGFTNLYNIEGGILRWSDEIDSSVPKY